MKGFWRGLKRPFVALAPMAGVTDPAFRRIIAKHGKPDVMWTEFVAVEALVRAEAKTREKLKLTLSYLPNERPIVAQLFGNDPHRLGEACKIVKELGFDGIDLNMGCPDKNVLKTGAGADLIKSPQLAQELIVAAKKAVGEEYPISVKTRIGYNVPEVDDWVRNILDVEPSALTLHLRTRKELSLVPARWTSDIIGRAAEINKKEYKGRTLLIGNGDITSYDEAMQKVAEFGLDGIMIGSSSADSRLHTQSLQELPTYNLPILCAGRATFGQPFMFTGRRGTLQERLRVMVEHTKLFDELMLPFQPISLMRKFYRAYVYGFHDAKTWRTKMMLAANTAEVEMHVEELIARLDSGEIEEDPNAPIPLRTS